MNIVTQCQGGHVRSVALKYLLTYKYGHNVLACGWESNNKETREMLYDWADYIIILDKNMEQYVDKKFHFKEDGSRKLFCYHVGEDRFGNPFHPELQQMLIGIIEKHRLFL